MVPQYMHRYLALPTSCSRTSPLWPKHRVQIKAYLLLGPSFKMKSSTLSRPVRVGIDVDEDAMGMDGGEPTGGTPLPPLRAGVASGLRGSNDAGVAGKPGRCWPCCCCILTADGGTPGRGMVAEGVCPTPLPPLAGVMVADAGPTVRSGRGDFS